MRQGLDGRRFSSRELVEAHLARIASLDSDLGAFLHVDADGALQATDAHDVKGPADAAPPLAGIPIAVKDNICTAGQPTTCASRLLEGYRPPYDATAVSRLRQAGAILIGKTNLDEFAMGSSCENSAFHATRNPIDARRVPGGSSGGSAAAVAVGEVPAALGSDTGGSIRQPAAFCGVVGLKPTYGRVSRYGLVAFASSLDQIGSLARDVDDAAILLEAIAGPDPNDATAATRPMPSLGGAGTALAGRVFGLPREYMGADLDEGVAGALSRAVAAIEGAGGTVREISLPTTAAAISAYYLIATAEASSNLARFDGVRFGQRRGDPDEGLLAMYEQTRSAGFGTEVKRRIILGTYALSAGYHDATYLRAQKVRTVIRKDFHDAFEAVEAIVTPTTPTVAFRLGDKVADPVSMYMSDIFTVPGSLAGLPAVSLPCGTSEGLPVGLQIIADRFDEPRLLDLARSVEAVLPVRNGQPGVNG
ncbi:MAG: Asp-tRNA(Asn)/Glu-tRNA(Gln) amidotransferase subunit GatA [Acidobacteriota bacterium]